MVPVMLVFAVLVFAFYLFLVRRLNREGGGTTLPPAAIDQFPPVADDLIDPVSPPPGWTALDDQQLTRLLRESSP